MTFTLDFHDSEVLSVRADPDGLRIRFSAAHVLRPGPGRIEHGYVRSLELLFAAANWSGEPGECVGRLTSGRLRAAGAEGRPLRVPSAWDGPVAAELNFHNGAVLSIAAASLVCRFTGDPRFMESYAC